MENLSGAANAAARAQVQADGNAQATQYELRIYLWSCSAKDFSSLDADEFIKEIKKRKPKIARGFSPKAVKEAREVYNDYAPAIQSPKAEALTLEHRLSDLVNQAYGLTPEEIDLMWKTAPPRMPINRR